LVHDFSDWSNAHSIPKVELGLVSAAFGTGFATRKSDVSLEDPVHLGLDTSIIGDL
jgi:hypothetical protein